MGIWPSILIFCRVCPSEYGRYYYFIIIIIIIIIINIIIIIIILYYYYYQFLSTRDLAQYFYFLSL